MAKDAIVFAMANPTPEVAPEEIEGLAAVIATGRSHYPNQINNVLAFPGIFRGALDVRASAITTGMEVAAGSAIAAVISDEELSRDYIVPKRIQPRRCRRRGGRGRGRGGTRRRRAQGQRERIGVSVRLRRNRLRGRWKS
jgi:malate dehydrogenase (oxaloacetate-decarboxylating)